MTSPQQQFNKGKVIEYAAAEPLLRAEMDKLMEPIDRNPDSFEAAASYGEAPRDRLEKIMADAQTLIDKAATTAVISEEDMRKAAMLGVARIEATRELGVYLGANREVLRRYNEEYIPQATQTYNANLDPGDDIYLHDVLKRKQDFLDRAAVLERARAVALVMAQHLRALRERAPGRFDDVALGRSITVARKPLQLKKPGAA